MICGFEYYSPGVTPLIEELERKACEEASPEIKVVYQTENQEPTETVVYRLPEKFEAVYRGAVYYSDEMVLFMTCSFPYYRKLKKVETGSTFKDVPTFFTTVGLRDCPLVWVEYGSLPGGFRIEYLKHPHDDQIFVPHKKVLITLEEYEKVKDEAKVWYYPGVPGGEVPNPKSGDREE